MGSSLTAYWVIEGSLSGGAYDHRFCWRTIGFGAATDPRKL